MKKRVVILGAAGRDFHNFLTFFKGNVEYDVVCFTAEQIPGIAGRKFPAKLAGKKYPKGIPIFSENKLEEIIKKEKIDVVCLSYSDLSHVAVMHKASRVLATGANFLLLGTEKTQVQAKKPLVAITAVRTGSGKSQTSRYVARLLKEAGKRVIAIRHPMPYGDLTKQEVQRFATYGDLKKHKCTIEEREEYEPWIARGIPIYAGVDYTKIVRKAEKEADIIIWDGGNNDMPFYKPDLHIVVADPHRAGHELLYYPGEVNLRAADIVVINKVDSAEKGHVQAVVDNIKSVNKPAKIVRAKSKIVMKGKGSIKNKHVLIVGDGPTLTHGGMSYGAGTVVAKKQGAKILPPAKSAVGSIKQTIEKYPHLKTATELPAMGYSQKQIKDLEASIKKAKAEVVIDGTPVNLERLTKLKVNFVAFEYLLDPIEKNIIKSALKNMKRK